MPSTQAFLDGFNVKVGTQLLSWRLEHIHIGHKVLKQYREYSFPMKLTFVDCEAADRKETKQASRHSTLIEQLTSHTCESKRILSQFGNPYLCTFGVPALASQQTLDAKRVVIAATGRGTRVFDKDQ